MVAIAFIAGFCIDFAWAWYLSAVRDERIIAASFASVLVGALGIVGVKSYMSSDSAIFPFLCGLFCGTYVYIWKSRLSR